MGFDLRLAIGAMFSLFGAILSVYGAFADKTIFAKSLGVNVDLDLGIVSLVFGLAMLAWARLGWNLNKA